MSNSDDLTMLGVFEMVERMSSLVMNMTVMAALKCRISLNFLNEPKQKVMIFEMASASASASGEREREHDMILMNEVNSVSYTKNKLKNCNKN